MSTKIIGKIDDCLQLPVDEKGKLGKVELQPPATGAALGCQRVRSIFFIVFLSFFLEEFDIVHVVAQCQNLRKEHGQNEGRKWPKHLGRRAKPHSCSFCEREGKLQNDFGKHLVFAISLAMKCCGKGQEGPFFWLSRVHFLCCRLPANVTGHLDLHVRTHFSSSTVRITETDVRIPLPEKIEKIDKNKKASIVRSPNLTSSGMAASRSKGQIFTCLGFGTGKVRLGGCGRFTFSFTTNIF